MSAKRIDLDPRICDTILRLIEHQAREPCQIVVIAIPQDGEQLGQPTFVTSFQPADMEQILIQIGEALAVAGDPIVNGGTKQ